jgi:PilZ domain
MLALGNANMTERRQYTRVYFSLPMEFQVQPTNSDASWKSPAVLKNFSRGGLFFECETLPQITPGNVADFTFNTRPPQYSFINSPIRAQAVVKRIESRVAGSENYGVAVQFLTGPQFG